MSKAQFPRRIGGKGVDRRSNLLEPWSIEAYRSDKAWSTKGNFPPGQVQWLRYRHMEDWRQNPAFLPGSKQPQRWFDTQWLTWHRWQHARDKMRHLWSLRVGCRRPMAGKQRCLKDNPKICNLLLCLTCL